MKMKKMFSLLLVGVLILSLGACGGSKGIKTAEEATKALKADGWTIQPTDEESNKMQQGFVANVAATKGFDYVSFVLFENADYAKTAFDVMKFAQSGMQLETVSEQENYNHMKLNLGAAEMNILQKDHALMLYGSVPENIKDLPKLLGMEAPEK